MKICILAGGLSPERDVSLSSAALIANALIQKGHTVALIDLYLGIEGNVVWLDKADFSYQIPECEPDLELLKRNTGRDSEIGPGVLDACKNADCVFLALHGGIGENGKLQSVLECMGIRFTGSSSEACILAMDKDLSKRMIRFDGIATADWLTFDSCNIDREAILDKIGFPCVVKPLSCGSSVGVSLVYNESELDDALALGIKYESRILVEKFISGREFSVGILNDYALPPIEIRPKEGFYDYKNKYQAGSTEEICPAYLTAEQTEEIKNSALAVHRSLRLGSYSRCDFILNEKTGEFICLEANALPGMTPTSLLPQEAAAAGIDYITLCDTIAKASHK